MAYIRDEFKDLTASECEEVAERFMEIMYRHRSSHSNHLTMRESMEKFRELYDDARCWVNDRRMAA